MEMGISKKKNLCDKIRSRFHIYFDKTSEHFKVSLIPNARVQCGRHSNYLVFTNEMEPVTKCFHLLDGVKVA